MSVILHLLATANIFDSLIFFISMIIMDIHFSVLSPDPVVDQLIYQKEEYIQKFLAFISQDGGVV